MNLDQRAITIYRFDDLNTAIMVRVALAFALLMVAGVIWLGLGPAHGVIAISLLAGGFIYFFHLMAREWVTLSDDSESVELARGEKALLRTLARFSWDSNLIRAGMAAASTLVGAAIGVAMVWGQWGEGTALICTLWSVLFLGFYSFTKFDQALARAYVASGARKLAEGDLAGAIGDASECLLLSMRYRYDAFMLRGQIWMQVGDPERAQREFQMAWSERPGCDIARQAYRAAVFAGMPDAKSADVERFTHLAHLMPTMDHSSPAHQDV